MLIRFAFGSDPAYSTPDDVSLTGLRVDDVKITDGDGDIIYIDKALPGKENYLGSFHFDSTPSDFTFMYAFQGYALSDVIKMACNAASYAGYTYIIIGRLRNAISLCDSN